MIRRILWVSHHDPHMRQLAALRGMYGEEVRVEKVPNSFADARSIALDFKKGGYDDMVIVAPLSVIAILCQEGVKPLWAESTEENDLAKIDFRGARGQGFRFVRFRRIKRVTLEFED